MKALKNILSIVCFFVVTLLLNMVINDIMASSGVSYALITAGFTKTCASRSGGCKNIWIANTTDIASAGFTLSGGAYTGVTMESGKVFYKFEFDEDTAEHRWNGSSEGFSTQVTNEVEFFLGLMSLTMRNALQELLDQSPCGLVMIVEDNNGTKWVYGYSENFPATSGVSGRPMKVQSTEAASGKVFTDANGGNVVMQSICNEYPRTYTGSVPV